MKIIITGSLGHISLPLTKELIQKGHTVTVISSNAGKQKDIEALGAGAAIGSIEDIDFLTRAFAGSDAVYCMTPPSFAEPDQVAYYTRVASNYAKAITNASVKRVVYLSSYGAHLEKGTGFIVGSHRAENLLNELPGVNVTHLRPGFFYYNLLSFIPMIKVAGIIGSNYGGEDQLAMVAPEDIAVAAAEELVNIGLQSKVRYVASDERTCSEVASVLGKVINKPDLQWLTLPDEQVQKALEGNGLTPYIAATLVELGAATHSGILKEDYNKHKPVLGKVKIENFAQEFAAAYSRQ